MNRFWYYLLLIGIALFVLSMGLLWRDNTAAEDSNDLTSIAAAVFLVFVVCGPGLLAKQVFTLLVPVESHAKNRRRLLREIRKAELVRSKAAAAKAQVQNWYAWYLQESNRMRNIYLLAYREAGGTKQENPYNVTDIRRRG